MIETYLNQTATWAARTTKNDFGEYSYGSAATINCRKVQKKQYLMGEKGAIVETITVVYTTSAVNEGDLVDSLPVKQVYIRYNLVGTEVFREVRLGMYI
jgi:hypothetical protein